MPLTLIGTGGLFTRLGKLIYAVDSIENLYRGTTLPGRISAIQAQYATTDQNLMDGIYSQLSNTQNSDVGMINYYKNLAQRTVTQMVNEFQPQTNNSYQTALQYLFDSLVATSDTVKRNTISTTVTPGGGNRGNGVVLVGSVNNYGFPQEQMFNESISVAVTRDSNNGASAGQETLQFIGTYGTTDMFNWLWPQGSNGQANLVGISPTVSNNTGTRNWLNNSMMETFSVPNVPDGWHIPVGTPGTSVLKDTVNFYDGASSLQFVGDGAEHTTLWTQFGVDISGVDSPVDQLAVNLWYKVAGSPAAGVMSISLVDGTGAVLNDSAGNPATLTKSLTSGGTSWTAFGGFLRMPAVLPTSAYLAVWLSTPLTAAATLNLDRICLSRPVTFYPGGPLLACFSGSSNWMIGDVYTVATNNAFNGLMQSGCNKLLNLSNYGIVFPSTTGTPTILDALVV